MTKPFSHLAATTAPITHGRIQTCPIYLARLTIHYVPLEHVTTLSYLESPSPVMFRPNPFPGKHSTSLNPDSLLTSQLNPLLNHFLLLLCSHYDRYISYTASYTVVSVHFIHYHIHVTVSLGEYLSPQNYKLHKE